MLLTSYQPRTWTEVRGHKLRAARTARHASELPDVVSRFQHVPNLSRNRARLLGRTRDVRDRCRDPGRPELVEVELQILEREPRALELAVQRAASHEEIGE